MNAPLTQDEFEQLKSFALKNNIKCLLTGMDKPIPPFQLSQLAGLKTGTVLDVGEVVSPLLFRTLQEHQAVITFTADAYDAEKHILTVEDQVFHPNQEQVQHLLTDNFGVIINDKRIIKMITKAEFEHNQALNDAHSQSFFFFEDVTHLKKMQTSEESFYRIKNNVGDYNVQHYLDQWDKPVFKPTLPNIHYSEIPIVGGFNKNAYYNAFWFGTGCEVFFDKNYNSETGLIESHEHCFKPNQEQLDTLKNDGVAYIVLMNGVTRFQSKSEKDERDKFHEDLKAWEAFNGALNAAFTEIQELDRVELCTALHEYLSDLPFEYYVAYKASTHLIDTDSKSNTVNHIVTKDAITGRLKRAAGDFLCGGVSSGSSSFITTEIKAAKNSDVKAQVTCKRCMEIAERMINQAKIQA